MGLEHNGLLTASISTINALSAQGVREEPARPTLYWNSQTSQLLEPGHSRPFCGRLCICGGYEPKSTLVIYWHLHLLSSSEEAICHYGNVNM